MKKNELEKIYDFDLMLDGGHIEGYLANSEAGNIGEALTALAVLGFGQAQAQAALAGADADMGVEELIKFALKNLA